MRYRDVFDRKVVYSVLITLAVVLAASWLFKKPEKQMEHLARHVHAIADPGFEREMAVLMGPDVLPGNRITPLENGDQIFPAMLEAIGSAKRSITFETYIYWSGQVGDAFAKALEDRARAGVHVHVMLDWFGSQKMKKEMLEAMKKSGVEVLRYHPLSWNDTTRLNDRTHRKLLVVDGTVGFIGGVGIADQWSGHAQDKDHWRDMHFRVEGPAVAEMQSAFLDDWIKSTGSVLHGDDYFPPLSPAGDLKAHLFFSSPSGGSASMHLMYLLSIAAATRSIDIEASYFVPDRLMIEALKQARLRGVRVRVLVPSDEHMDSETIKLASQHDWGDLLKAGVEFHIYQPTMLHCKMLVLDGHMVSVGSTNFDMRSFELNDEASLNVYDDGFARTMSQVFEDDLSHSTPFTYDMWKHRPWTKKLSEWFVMPVHGQL